MKHILLRVIIFFIVFAGKAICDQSKIDQSEKALLNRTLSSSDRESAYIALLNSGESGFKNVSDLLAKGIITTDEWADWSYDYQSRFSDANNEKIFENFLFNRIKNEESFAKLFSQHFAEKLKDINAFDYLKNSSVEIRRLGFIILRSRYYNLPPFSFDSDDAERATQLKIINKFLKNKRTAAILNDR